MTEYCLIDYFDAAELAAAVLDLPEIEADEDIDTVADAFLHKFGMDLEQFAELARRLVPMCAMDKSPLTDTFRRGFVRDGAYIVKITTETP